MLHLTLYNYSNANIKIDKSGFLTSALRLTGNQLDEVQTLTDVEIIIQSSTAPTYNYCRIQEFNRYYFITNVTWLGGTAFQLSLHVDVLYTYASNINALSALVDYSLLGSSIEYDPRMNYVDQPVVTRALGSLYPNFLLDQTSQNTYTNDPWVMIRYYQLQNGNVNSTSIECAFMSLTTYNYFVADYLSSVHTEAERIDFGARIIDVNNVYYINEYRLSQATTYSTGVTICTPKYPNGITIYCSDPDDPTTLAYIIKSPANVDAMGYALVQGGAITTPTNWTLGGEYITKIPYIGELSFIPAKAGIKTAETFYYAIAIDPYNAQYVITLTNRTDGTGTWYFENEQHISIKTTNAFPIDTSFDNATLRKIQLAIDGTISAVRGIANEEGVLPVLSDILGTVGHIQGVNAAEAIHYKYTGEFNGAAEWTPADTKRLVNTSVIIEPDTNYSVFWSEFGRPDHEMRTLSALTGYYKIGGVNMRGFGTATKAEVDETEKLLKAGVIA